MRGRDIKRYGYNFADLWLIHTHNGIKEKHIPPVDINLYPVIKAHLDKSYPALEKRQDKGITPYNLRNCAYTDDFSKQKIIWGEISDKSKFCFDENGFLLDVTTFFMTGNHLKYLLAILNSRLCEWMFNQIGTTTGVGTNRWKKYKLETLFVKTPSISEENKLGSLIDKLREKEYYDKELILDIDMSIYKLYNINNTEIEFLNSY